MSRFEAVIYDEDVECSHWHESDTAPGAISGAVSGFLIECHDYIEPGDYTVTLYDRPMTRHLDGEDQVIAWADRARVRVTITATDDGWSWERERHVTWDGAPGHVGEIDPATLGCLLALVRTAWGDPHICALYDGPVAGPPSWRVASTSRHITVSLPGTSEYPTEAEALLAALAAAPVRTP